MDRLTINREPIGSTLLKWRQVYTLDDIQIISVPYWFWDKFGTDRTKKQMYLRCKLGWIAEQQKRFPRSDSTTSLHLAAVLSLQQRKVGVVHIVKE